MLLHPGPEAMLAALEFPCTTTFAAADGLYYLLAIVVQGAKEHPALQTVEAGSLLTTLVLLVSGGRVCAVRLFGASEVLREVMGTPPEPGDSALQEPYLAAARSQLDETSWQEVWAEGRAMTLDEAISYALQGG